MMNEDVFDTSVRKLLKKVGITASITCARMGEKNLPLSALPSQSFASDGGSRSRIKSEHVATHPAFPLDGIEQFIGSPFNVRVSAGRLLLPPQLAASSSSALALPKIEGDTPRLNRLSWYWPSASTGPRNFERVIVGAQISVDHALAGRGDRYQSHFLATGSARTGKE
jgi:hypothetical protein